MMGVFSVTTHLHFSDGHAHTHIHIGRCAKQFHENRMSKQTNERVNGGKPNKQTHRPTDILFGRNICPIFIEDGPKQGLKIKVRTHGQQQPQLLCH